MHILLIRTATAVSGAEIYNLNLIKGFRKYYPGNSFSYITNLQAFADRLEEIGIEGKVIPIFNEEIGTKRGLLRLLKIFPIYLYSYLKSIRNINRKQKIDIILMQSTTEKIALTFWLRLAGYKMIWLEHVPFFSFPTSKIIFSLYRLLCSSVEKLITVSEDSRKDLLNNKITNEKVKRIYAGVRTPHKKTICVKGNKPPNVNKIKYVVGYLGTISKIKGINIFVNVAFNIIKQNSDTSFNLVGKGPMLRKIKRQVSERRYNDLFHFPGFVKNPFQILKEFDIFLFPTFHNEGLSLSLLEISGLGVVSIARDIGGNRELIVHGKTGYLFKNESDEQIADMVIELLQNPAKRKRMGEAARKRVQKYFSLKRWITEMHDLFEEVSNKNRR